MKFVIDEAVPFLEGVFEPYAETVYKAGRNICHDDLIDADALIIRSRTRCTAELLEGTGIKIIATASIGTDHIDMEFCRNHGIYVQNASGSNAGGVMDYVFSALYGAAARKAIKLPGATFGIIGVGNVGSRVARMASALGFHVFMCDPPRAEKEHSTIFCDLDFLLQNSLIVSLHVPLTNATRGMAGEDFFSQMLPGAVFINTARGEIVDEAALKKAIPKLGSVIIDTWDHEPNVDKELIDMVDIATPHIAGYSYQGKQNGTSAAVRAVARFFGISALYDFFPKTPLKELEAVKLDVSRMAQGGIASVFQYNYPIFTDDFMFRMDPDSFETLRQEYKYRREFYIE